MKKPFYSKHHRSACVSRILPNPPKTTKSDYLRIMFKFIGIPVIAWQSLETRYKNKFNLDVIKNSCRLVLNLDKDFLEPWPHNDELCQDLFEITHSKAFKDFVMNKIHFFGFY